MRRRSVLVVVALGAACYDPLVGSGGETRVAPGAGTDPSAGAPAVPKCPIACDDCIGGVCHIRCGDGACAALVVCPPDLPCHVSCFGHDACHDGVDCGDASSCAADCSGAGACEHGVTCDGAGCQIRCTGDGSCEDGVCCAGDDCPGCTSANGGCCRCGGYE